MPKIKFLPERDEREKFFACTVKQIKKHMIDSDVDQNALSKKTGITVSTLSKKFNDPQRIKLEDLYKISKVLKVNINELIGG